MAVTLQLTDGTTTVDFNDGTTLKLSSAFQMNVGAGTVNELVIAAWVPSTSTDTAAATMRSANKLFRKAQRSARERRIDQWVWLAWKPDEQTNTQYARVLGGGFAEVDTYQIGGKQTGVWTVDVLRAGDWWDTVPNTAFGSSESAGFSGTVYNKSDADGDNWLSFAARDGDLPTLLEVNVDPDQAMSAIVMATKSFDDSTQADLFNPHFNAADRASGGTLTAETAAPDDQKVTASADVDIVWNIADTNLEAYYGRYQAWGWIRRTAGSAGDTYVAIKTPNKTNEAIDPGAGGGPQYLGIVEIPGTDFFPLRDTETTYTLSIEFTQSGSGAIEMYGIWLVPVDQQVIRLQIPSDVAATDNRLIVNGAYEVSYVEKPDTGATPTYNIDYTKLVEVAGEYPRLEPDRYTRLFFYAEWNYSVTGVWPSAYDYNDSFSVRGLYVDRYLSLRGST